MTTFLATHEPFLQSRAKLLILPMSADGTILNPVLARTKSLYPSNYEAYKRQAVDGQLRLGDALLHKTETHTTGLSPSTHQADYIANLITTHHAHHSTELSTLKTGFTALHPKLFELMRYHGLRQVAMLATPLFLPPTGNPAYATPSTHRPMSGEQFWQTLIQTLEMPRLHIAVHFSKDIVLDFV